MFTVKQSTLTIQLASCCWMQTKNTRNNRNSADQFTIHRSKINKSYINILFIHQIFRLFSFVIYLCGKQKRTLQHDHNIPPSELTDAVVNPFSKTILDLSTQWYQDQRSTVFFLQYHNNSCKRTFNLTLLTELP